MMASRPRRSAAQRATAAITDMADRDTPERPLSSRSRRSETSNRGNASVTRGPTSSSTADSPQHIHLNIKMPSNKLRQATSGKRSASSGNGRDSPAAGESVTAKRSTRGKKKSYVIESESNEDDEDEEEGEEMIVAGGTMLQDDDDDDDDDEEDEEEDAEGEEDDDMEPGDDDDDDDAEGEELEEDEMDVDAEGEEDADGDIDMDVTPAPPSIIVSKPTRGKTKISVAPRSQARSTPAKPSVKFDDEEEDDDDDELSELDSEPEEADETVEVAGEVDEDEEEDAEGEEDDMDAEGEEIEVIDEDAEGEEDLGSVDDGESRDETPDMSRMTARQRARHGDIQEYMKLSDEVQVKKVFTAEEHAMRRAEMARRRRNLSEKRTEEVKMETINKLLKKQAPKTNKRSAGDETPDNLHRANPTFVRFISNKDGNMVSVPDEMLLGPAGKVFGGIVRGKMVEEVS